MTSNQKSVTTIPRSLVYEEFDGHVFPYKGFQKVLDGETDLAGVVGTTMI